MLFEKYPIPLFLDQFQESKAYGTVYVLPTQVVTHLIRDF